MKGRNEFRMFNFKEWLYKKLSEDDDIMESSNSIFKMKEETKEEKVEEKIEEKLEENLLAMEEQMETQVMSLAGPWSPITKQVTLQLNIPLGFQAEDGDIIQFSFSMDYHNLTIKKEIILAQNQTITFKDEEDKVNTITCDVPVGKVMVNGVLYSNTVVSGFSASSLVEPGKTNGSVIYVDKTGFSYAEDQLVNELMGYVCQQYDISEAEYMIDVIMNTPYILDSQGNKKQLQPVVEGQQIGMNLFSTSSKYYGTSEMNGKDSVVIYMPTELSISVEPVS